MNKIYFTEIRNRKDANVCLAWGRNSLISLARLLKCLLVKSIQHAMNVQSSLISKVGLSKPQTIIQLTRKLSLLLDHFSIAWLLHIFPQNRNSSRRGKNVLCLGKVNAWASHRRWLQHLHEFLMLSTWMLWRMSFFFFVCCGEKNEENHRNRKLADDDERLQHRCRNRFAHFSATWKLPLFPVQELSSVPPSQLFSSRSCEFFSN